MSPTTLFCIIVLEASIPINVLTPEYFQIFGSLAKLGPKYDQVKHPKERKKEKGKIKIPN